MHAALVVLVAWLAQASPITSVDPDAKSKAQVLLKEGTALYQQGSFAAALAKFEAAYGIYPSPKLKFNIAQANRDLGRLVEAVQAFEAFLVGAPEAAPEIIAEARQSSAELAGRLGQLRVECQVVGADVTIDGRVVGITPLAKPVWVTPGSRQVTIRHPKYMPSANTVTVVAGRTETLSRQLLVVAATAPPPVEAVAAAQPAVPPPLDRPPTFWSRQKWYFWAAAGATVAFTAGAVVTGLAAQSKYKQLEGSCGLTVAGCSEREIDSVKGNAQLATAFWILAGAAAVGTGISIYVDRREAGMSVAWKF